MEASELEIVRRADAIHVMAAAGVEDARVEAAFGVVKREDFRMSHNIYYGNYSISLRMKTRS